VGDPKTDILTGKVWVDVRNPATDGQFRRNRRRQRRGSIDQLPGHGIRRRVKVDYAAFEGVLYGYDGKGVGTTGLYVLPTSASGSKRKSDGGYVQGTYKFDKLKVGSAMAYRI